MKIAIMNAKVAVRRAPAKLEEKTAGGIYKPKSSIKEKNEGIVVAVGPSATCVQKGDIIIFGAWAGEDMVYEDEKLILMDEAMIYAVKREAADESAQNITSVESIQAVTRKQWPDCFSDAGELEPQPDPAPADPLTQSWQ
jgi:co-chaperonin GroES (HSP10)